VESPCERPDLTVLDWRGGFARGAKPPKLYRDHGLGYILPPWSKRVESLSGAAGRHEISRRGRSGEELRFGDLAALVTLTVARTYSLNPGASAPIPRQSESLTIWHFDSRSP